MKKKQKCFTLPTKAGGKYTTCVGFQRPDKAKKAQPKAKPKTETPQKKKKKAMRKPLPFYTPEGSLRKALSKPQPRTKPKRIPPPHLQTKQQKKRASMKKPLYKGSTLRPPPRAPVVKKAYPQKGKFYNIKSSVQQSTGLRPAGDRSTWIL